LPQDDARQTPPIVRESSLMERTTMSETKRIAQDQLTRYFDAFSKRFLMPDSPESADVEVVGGSVGGDQRLASGVRLLGVDNDPHTNALELEL
jgi:hypothetical protein